jgi:hypothetical protein
MVMECIEGIQRNPSNETRINDFLQHRENGPGWNSKKSTLIAPILKRERVLVPSLHLLIVKHIYLHGNEVY